MTGTISHCQLGYIDWYNILNATVSHWLYKVWYNRGILSIPIYKYYITQNHCQPTWVYMPYNTYVNGRGGLNTLTLQSKPIYHWINVNRNVDKTESILLGTCQKLRDALKNVPVGEDEYTVTPILSHKHFGIHVNNTLSWNNITHLCSKPWSRVYLISHVKYLMPLSITKQYFSDLVQPVMDYLCVIWGNCIRDLLIKVHKMMKMYARSILDIKDKWHSSSVKLLQTVGCQ